MLILDGFNLVKSKVAQIKRALFPKRLTEYIELEYQNIEKVSNIAELLAQGRVIVIRNIPEILKFRHEIFELSDKLSIGDNKPSAELTKWLDFEIEPSIATVAAFSKAVKQARNTRYLPYLLEGLVSKLSFPAEIKLHHGMARVIFSKEIIAEAISSRLFTEDDFKRKDSDGYGEFFMPSPSNIHRDFNRWHSVLMCNLWFTLHNAEPDEVIRIFHKVYKVGVSDIDNTTENSKKLPEPLSFRLGLGDAVLFHGEQLHASPAVGHSKRRFSFDVRVAADCIDDNAHYRKDFFDLKNFISREKMNLQDWISNNPDQIKDSEVPVIYLLNKLENGIFLNDKELTQLIHKISEEDFIEDALLALSRLVEKERSELSLQCLHLIIDRSNLPYFLFQAATFLAERGCDAEARRGFQKVIDFSDVKVSDYTPISYMNKNITQKTPSELAKAARVQIELLS